MNCVRTLMVLSLIVLLGCDCHAAGFAKGWKNTLKPKGKPGPELVLASGGKANYIILLSEKATTQEEKAATDLAQWLKEITGADFPVVHEGRYYRSTHPLISIGKTELFLNANIPDAKIDLKEEGYAIAANGENLYLWGGNTRGPINAVYALLEEDLGCRWYDKDSATIPNRPELRFRPVPRHFIPVLEIRDPYYFEAFDKTWSLRNRANSSYDTVPAEWGGNFEYAMFVHTFDAFLPREKYFKDHPEYYALVNGKRVGGQHTGQLCLTNNDVLNIVIDEVRRSLREKPNARVISVSPNDGLNYCECPSCKAIDDREGTNAGSLITFVNKVAEAIEGEFPDVSISTLAYLGTFIPPKTIKPRHNVAIQFCTEAHAWPHPFTFITDGPDKVYEALKGWSAIGARIHIWDYTVNFGGYLTIMPNMPVVSENMRTYIKNGARGIMLQGNVECHGSDNTRMRCWVWAKQMWDPSLDTLELMKDFIYGYYGNAAEPMWKYNMLIWKLWETNYARTRQLGNDSPFQDKSPYAPYWTKDFVDDATALFDEAERMSKDSDTLRRVKREKASLLYTKISQEVGYWAGQYQRHIGRVLIKGT
ncbi:MAG: DUF4838 domain-containing protein, partial [Armatimonadetes bacterium]|nr:DUF4838 domain-containing protein [Armatimonadota bacterium]